MANYGDFVDGKLVKMRCAFAIGDQPFTADTCLVDGSALGKELTKTLGNQPFMADVYLVYGELKDAQLQAEEKAKLDEYLYGHRDDSAGTEQSKHVQEPRI